MERESVIWNITTKNPYWFPKFIVTRKLVLHNEEKEEQNLSETFKDQFSELEKNVKDKMEADRKNLETAHKYFELSI